MPALRLHAHALLASFEAGHAGFVTDAFLRAANAPHEVQELCRHAIWARGDGGYRVIASEARRMADEVFREAGHRVPPRER